MNEPFFSILIPVYNTEKTLTRCIRSVSGDDRFSIEIIAVDDGSTDSSPELLKKIAQEDDRIRIITHEKNKSLLEARRTGVAACHGKFVLFLDSDDRFTDGALSTLYDRLNGPEGDVDVLHFSFRVLPFQKIVPSSEIADPAERLRALLQKENALLPAISNKVYRGDMLRRAYEKVEGNDQTKPDNDQPTNPDNGQPTNPDNGQPMNPDNDQPTEQPSNRVVEVNRYYKVEEIDPSTYTYIYTIYNAWGQAVYSETTNKYFEFTMLGEHIIDIKTLSGDGGAFHRYFNVMSTSFDDSKKYQAVIAASTDYVAYLNDNNSKVIVKSILDDSFYKEFQMPTDLYYANPMPVFSASLSHDTLYMHYDVKNNYRSAFISFRFREDKSHSFANYNAILELVQDICTTLPTYEEQTDYAAAFGITDAQEIEWLDKLFFSLRDLHPAKKEATLSTNHLKTVGYAIKDLNADGIHELVLLCEDYNVIAIFSIYRGDFFSMLLQYWNNVTMYSPSRPRIR